MNPQPHQHMLLVDVDNLQQNHYVYEACERMRAACGPGAAIMAVGPAEKANILAPLRDLLSVNMRHSSPNVSQAADRLIKDMCVKQVSRWERYRRISSEEDHKLIPHVAIASSDKDFFALSRYLRSHRFETTCITRDFAIPNGASDAYDHVIGLTGHRKNVISAVLKGLKLNPSHHLNKVG